MLGDVLGDVLGLVDGPEPGVFCVLGALPLLT
jgi:hypothetical protein